MSINLYVANVDLSITEAEIAELFTAYDKVLEARHLVNQRTHEPREAVLVRIASAEAALLALEHLNGQRLGERPLFISFYHPPAPAEPTLAQQTVAEEIAQVLGETEAIPRRHIQKIIQWGTIPFAYALLTETESIEHNGGLLVRNGSRRRTPGGVFFHLAELYLSTKVRRLVFEINKPQKPHPPTEKPQDAKTPASSQDAKSPQAVPSQPPSDSSATIAQQHAALKQALQEKQAQLQAIQQGQASPAGLFSLTKEIWQLQTELRHLEETYPELKS